ncbi:MAG: hypothetical protein WCK93_00995 [Nitrosomonadales bacterium]
MSLHDSFTGFLDELKDKEFIAELGGKGGYLTFSNSGIRGSVKKFTISLEAFLSGFVDIQNNLDKFTLHQRYVEGEWRELGGCFQDLTLKSIAQVQTKPTFSTMSKIIAWANDKAPNMYSDNAIEINVDSIAKTIEQLSILVDCYTPKERKIISVLINTNVCSIPKPFLLLAGISGTGKTRFVREQAKASRREGNPDNYCLIPVRPDWHEPSDLLGYVSRIGANGSARYVVTDLLRFVVRAWLDAAAPAGASTIVLPCKSPDEMTPYWLCLDEMNLAPVEQYFADYLSVVETRKWDAGYYTCDPLLKGATIKQLGDEGRKALREELKLDDPQYDGLWGYFLEKGIPLPPNLIVAGTVNMDETTHGFSRKVIDRAFTIDFGVFYPNDFTEFFDEDKISLPKTLSFPLISKVTRADLVDVEGDKGGENSIQFLVAINKVLSGSPFELAYRALNELLLAVVCFNPKDDAGLYAVWDDFLMSKVLPRIDGDAEKLNSDGTISLLTRLQEEIFIQFKDKKADRPDLLRENSSGECRVVWRAEQKLKWMQTRLTDNGFTTFWP